MGKLTAEKIGDGKLHAVLISLEGKFLTRYIYSCVKVGLCVTEW